MSVLTATELPFRVNLAALPDAPKAARRFLAKLLQLWRVGGETADDAVLLVSELVTNATRATGRAKGPDKPGPTETVPVIIVRARITPDDVCVEVWDNSPLAPVPTDADDDSESGRGLQILGELADEWGWEPMIMPPREAPGKLVWFRLKLREPRQPSDPDAAREIEPAEIIVNPHQGYGVGAIPQPRPAVPPNRPVAESLPHRVKRPSPALIRKAVPRQPSSYDNSLRAMRQLHAALRNLDHHPTQSTGDPQCVNA